VTWASNRQDRDKGFEYADVISFNGYPGWYGGGADTVVDSWSKAADWVEQNWPKKVRWCTAMMHSDDADAHMDPQPVAARVLTALPLAY
jgi:hypothetical protein